MAETDRASPRQYFGTPAQQALEARADQLWRIVRGDPRYTCHGRAVALAERSAEAVELQIALAGLQGVGPSDRLTPDVARERIAALEHAGLVVDIYQHWSAEPSAARRAARRILASHALPEGLAVETVDAQTPASVYDRLDALTQSCGVLLPAAGFLRGDVSPAVCVYAVTGDREVVGAAAAVVESPDATPNAGEVWWGMLSTAEGWRGHGIAKHLGARALVAMSERATVARFWTGIREGNVASARICEGMGFAETGLLDVIAIDPVTMSGGRLTT